MPSPTMASRLVDAANVLLDSGSRSTALRRRAVSTAYYAVFHALAKTCADFVTQAAPRQSDAYLRAYRALDHGSMKSAFGKSPLNDHPVFKEIGSIVVRLQAERHRADYLPPIRGLFPVEAVAELVGMARYAVDAVEGIQTGHEDRRTLAISLLFKERNG